MTAPPGYLSNSELATRISKLVDRWDTRENQMKSLLTQPSGNVQVTDGSGVTHVFPSYPQLQKNIEALTDEGSGVISEARDINQTTIALVGAAQDAVDSVGTYTPVAGVPRPLQSKLGDAVTVKDFGAVGDGAFDDSGAFLSAPSGTLVPAGIYRIESDVPGTYYASGLVELVGGGRVNIERTLGINAIDPGLGYQVELHGNIPFKGPAYESLRSLIGNPVHLYPQGFAVDWQSREMFLIRDGSNNQVVEVYDWDSMVFKTCFVLKLPDGATVVSKVSESLVVRYEDGDRILYVNAAVGELHRFDITTTPPNLSSLVSLGAVLKTSVNLSFDFDGREWITEDRTAPLSGGQRRHRYIRWNGNLTERLGDVDFGLLNSGAGTGIYSKVMLPKHQGFAAGHGGYWFGIGGRRTDLEAAGAYADQGIRYFAANGQLTYSFLCESESMRSVFNDNGIEAQFLESEGIQVSPEGDVYTLMVTLDGNSTGTGNQRGGIVLLRWFSRSVKSINLTPASTQRSVPDINTLQVGMFPRSGFDAGLYNPVTGEKFTSWVDIKAFMEAVDLSEFSYYSSSVTILDHTGQPVPNGLKITLHNCNNGTTFVTGLGAHGQRVWRITSSGAQSDQSLLQRGTGSPEGAVVSAVGGLYVDTSAAGGNVLYVKSSGGSGASGWVAK